MARHKYASGLHTLATCASTSVNPLNHTGDALPTIIDPNSAPAFSGNGEHWHASSNAGLAGAANGHLCLDARLSDSALVGQSGGRRGSPSIVDPAVEVALACNVATLRCGPHTFDFEKTYTALHDVELRLSHREDCACDGDKGPGHSDGEARSIERLVPAVTGDLDNATRAGIEKERLLAVGRALFAHVARLIINAENQPSGRRGLRLSTLTRTHSHMAEVHRRGRVCERSGCGTVLSMYNPSCSCALHMGVANL